MPQVADKYVAMMLNPDTIWGIGFLKECQKYGKKHGVKLIHPHIMTEDQKGALVVLATAFTNEILRQINKTESVEATERKLNVDDLFTYSNDVFNEQDEYTDQIYDWDSEYNTQNT